MLGHKLCSVMVKQEQSPELPVDPLAASSAMAAAAMATTPLLGLSPLTRLPVAHQVSLGPIHRGRGWGGVDLCRKGHPKPWAPRGSEHGAAWPFGVSRFCLCPHLGPPFHQSRTDSDHRGPHCVGKKTKGPRQGWALGTPSRVSGKETAQDT